MTPFEEILRRKKQRQAWDETLPDGRSVADVLQGQRPTPQDQVLTPQNQQAVTRPRRVGDSPLTQIGQRIRAEDAVTDKRAQQAGGMSYPQWIEAQRTGRIPMSVDSAARSGATQPPMEANRLGGYVPPGAHWEQWDKPNDYGDTGEYISGTPNRPTGNTPSAPMVGSSDAQRQRAVTFNPQTGRPNEDYYRQRNDPMGLYNAYENWQPHGGKRGFKNSLKAGALTAARVAQMTDNPAAIVAGFGVGAAGGAVNPDFKNKLVQGFKTEQLGGELSNRLKLQREQTNINMAQMVPVTLDNGEQVLVPARTAAGLQSRQQEIGIRGDTLEARKKRWDALGEHEGARDAQALYNSGAADDSSELRAEIAKRLRLPAGTVLPPRGLGNQIKIDDTGNYVIVNPRSGAVTNTGQRSFAETQETGRDTRQRRALDAAAARTQMQQAGADRRAGMRQGAARLPAAVQTRVAAGVGALEGIKNDLTQLDTQITQLDNASKGREKTPEEMKQISSLGRQRQQKVNEAKRAAAELNTLDPNNESGVGEGGYPYRKPREGAQAAPSSGRTIEGAIDAFTRKLHRAPTADEIAKMKAALEQ